MEASPSGSSSRPSTSWDQVAGAVEVEPLLLMVGAEGGGQLASLRSLIE